MWGLDFPKIEKFLGSEPWPKIAVETGTCRGNGARALARQFSRVFTIELDPALHEHARERLSGDFPGVEFIQGSSPQELERLLPSLGSEAIFFFLDAHWSGDSSVDWEKSQWKGYGLDTGHLGAPGQLPSSEEQCPLMEELEVIVKYCAGPAVILVDDMKNLLGAPATFQGESWAHLSTSDLLKILAPRLTAHTVLENPCQWLLRVSSLLC